MTATLTTGTAHPLATLVTPTEQGIASRVLGRTTGGNLTLFALDAGQELSEHTSPFEAFAIVLEGAVAFTIDGTPIDAAAGTIVRLPAHVPHAVHARTGARMLLAMLRELKTT